MKKILFTCFLFFFIVPVSAKEIKIVGLGDSITTGFGTEHGYFKQICETFEKNDSKDTIICQNFAVDGLTSTGLLEQIQTPEIKENITQADYIFMSIGGNDFLKEMSALLGMDTASLQPETIKQIGDTLLSNMETIYTILFTYQKDVVLSVVPLYDPYYTIIQKLPLLQESFEDIQKRYISLGNSYQAHVSETLGFTLENHKYLQAGVVKIDPHPNTEGHTLIRKELWKSIQTKESKKENIHHSFLYILIIVLLFIFLIFLYKYARAKKQKIEK